MPRPWLNPSLRRQREYLSTENQSTLRTLFRGKFIIVILFAAIPIFVLLRYRTHAFEQKACPTPSTKMASSKNVGANDAESLSMVCFG